MASAQGGLLPSGRWTNMEGRSDAPEAKVGEGGGSDLGPEEGAGGVLGSLVQGPITHPRVTSTVWSLMKPLIEQAMKA